MLTTSLARYTYHVIESYKTIWMLGMASKDKVGLRDGLGLYASSRAREWWLVCVRKVIHT